MSQRDELIKKLRALTYDNILLEKEIRQLHLELSVKGSRKHEFNSESDEEDTECQHTLAEYKKEKQLLHLSRLCCGIHFVTESCVDVVPNMQIHHGVGELEHIRFDFHFEIEKDGVFKSIDIKFKNEAIEQELGEWRKILSRKRDLMQLMRGISSYSNLLSQMKTLLASFKETLYNIFEITFDVTGIIAKSKKKEKSGTSILTIFWRIVWNETINNMVDSFLFEMGDLGLFSEKLRKKLDAFSREKFFSPNDIKKFWIEMSTLPEILI